MREYNRYQAMEAAKLNAIQIMKENPNIKHVMYGHRIRYDTPVVSYICPLKFDSTEMFERYCEIYGFEVVYVINCNGKEE